MDSFDFPTLAPGSAHWCLEPLKFGRPQGSPLQQKHKKPGKLQIKKPDFVGAALVAARIPGYFLRF